MKKLLILFLLPFTLTAQVVSYNFDNGSLSQGGVFLLNCVTPRNPGFATDSFLTSGKCFYASVSKTDSVCGGSHRTEINTTVATFSNYEWMYWETYQPSWPGIDNVPYASGQIHAGKNVPFYLRTFAGRTEAVLQNSATNSNVLTTNKVFLLGNFATNSWHNWLIHFKRSAFSDGFLEMWADGVYMFKYTGPTADLISGSSELAWYAKFGIYKSAILSSSLPTAVSATDNIKFGTSAATVNDFYPPNTTPITPVNGVKAKVKL